MIAIIPMIAEQYAANFVRVQIYPRMRQWPKMIDCLLSPISWMRPGIDRAPPSGLWYAPAAFRFRLDWTGESAGENPRFARGSTPSPGKPTARVAVMTEYLMISTQAPARDVP